MVIHLSKASSLVLSFALAVVAVATNSLLFVPCMFWLAMAITSLLEEWVAEEEVDGNC